MLLAIGISALSWIIILTAAPRQAHAIDEESIKTYANDERHIENLNWCKKSNQAINKWLSSNK